MRALPGSEAETRALLEEGRYVADDALVKTLYLSFALGRPLLLEGEAGCGKTQLAATLAETLGRRLLRLQCHEGLDSAAAVYEWNYAAQMLAIRLAERGGTGRDALAEDIFGERFLVKRPLLTALEPDPLGPPVLLIDEIDRADAPFEAYLLEVLSEFQVSVPEVGTVTAAERPIVVITSNRTREVHDALKRRCLYHWVDYPGCRAGEGDPARAPAGGRAAAERQHRRLHRAHAEGRPLHGAGAGRGDRVVERRGPARPDRARPRDHPGQPRAPARLPARPRGGQRPRPDGAARPPGQRP